LGVGCVLVLPGADPLLPGGVAVGLGAGAGDAAAVGAGVALGAGTRAVVLATVTGARPPFCVAGVRVPAESRAALGCEDAGDGVGVLTAGCRGCARNGDATVGTPNSEITTSTV
jgi:hypothetical protein